ncbi:thiamine phosphate synthase [Polaribacter sp. HL-MS24]|uniref:thiamine phosphate synthase n=1 Tax=Polaribacter sp. HL-MS24 TaxID=3077735 RepID=UPI002934DD24|nr:thiamine phosphate synthase [Polaribacter sp. HL-MS24]WOC40087.1 thiamine phosphate synthase [Polaribacter sp. HL-MS24]
MIIPKLHYISQGNSPKEHLENIQKACTSGAELVELCLRNVSDKKILETAAAAREITSHFQTRLILNGHYKIAKDIKADGVRLEKNDSCPTIVRMHLYTLWQMIGGTANTLQECKNHIKNEVDYICLTPFRNKEIKENIHPAMGLKGYKAILESLETETPMIGFGGITTTDVTEILKTGVTGIGVSEQITTNFDLIRTFNQLLSASSTKEQRHEF